MPDWASRPALLGMRCGRKAQISPRGFSGASLDYIRFSWGSPNFYNTLTVKSGEVGQAFTVGLASLNFGVTKSPSGSQSFSQ